jgi:hypothetical protein
MPESTLSIQYSDLLLAVATFLGYGADSTAWTVAETAEVDLYVQSGVRQFYYPPTVGSGEAGYEWSFMNPTATLDTVADDAAQDLPDDLGRVLGDFFFASSEYRASIVQVDEHRINTMLSRSSDTDAPIAVCVRHKALVAGTSGTPSTAGQRLEAVWYPIPNDAYTLTYKYEAYSGKLSAVNPYPLGGMRHSELLTESCLSIAEQRANDAVGQHTELFQRLLVSSIAMDKRQGAKNFGTMGSVEGGSGMIYSRTKQSSYPVTYNGETW